MNADSSRMNHAAASPVAAPTGRPFVATTPPDRRNRRFAWGAIVVSIVALVAMAPYAGVHLPRMASFIPSYEASLVVIDLVTAVLLLSEFSILKHRSLLVIACAYFINTLLVAAHAFSFPTNGSAIGLFGDAQTTGWLYVFWHACFPVLVVTYAMLARSPGDALPPRTSASKAVGVALAATAVAAALLVLLADAGARALPILIVDGDYSRMVTTGVTPAIIVVCLVGIALLGPHRSRSVLDLWLFAVLWVWICDVVLSAVVSSVRYDLGWYGGRIFALLAASFVLIALLFEFNKLHAQLATAMTEAEARNDELVRSRDALVRVQRFEALGQLTGGIAHDFNNLLTAITGGLEMIVRRPADTDRVLRLAGNATKAAERGSQLIRRLMSFARKQSLRPEVLDANQTLREFGSLVTSMPDSLTTIRFAFDDVGTICVDESEFQAAFLNLIVNARDAMPHGGEIVVSTRIVTLTEAELVDTDASPGRFVQIEVADRGVGMSPEVQTRIFEPFFTTKSHGLGTGLGLSQVYGFVRSAGGQVVVRSVEGEGTTIALNLPPSTAAHIERQQLPEREERATSGVSVLLVEDDSDVLVATKDRVEELGYTVVTATSGDEAFDLLVRGLAVDIVFSDMVMPGRLNGVQLAEAALRIRPRLKLVLTSGYTGGALDQFRLPQGLLFLAKPYTQKDLADKLVAAVAS